MNESKETMIHPARGIVVLKPAGSELAQINSKSSIEVSVDKQPQIGVVVEVGLPKLNVDGDEILLNLDLKPGDVVAYRRFGESNFYIGSKKIMFVDQGDLLGIIEI